MTPPLKLRDKPELKEMILILFYINYAIDDEMLDLLRKRGWLDLKMVSLIRLRL